MACFVGLSLQKIPGALFDASRHGLHRLFYGDVLGLPERSAWHLECIVTRFVYETYRKTIFGALGSELNRPLWVGHPAQRHLCFQRV